MSVTEQIARFRGHSCDQGSEKRLSTHQSLAGKGLKGQAKQGRIFRAPGSTQGSGAESRRWQSMEAIFRKNGHSGVFTSASCPKGKKSYVF